ncbi:MAG TPA: response regulator [Oscillatoriaceae cyanobacterium M33_DOE_052]|uniref:histidine kinase n=1 Tax=Planktothricoides sp. SpSt-374 TaxID=2282167 RepID=A0A7C3ZK37_9CYAN|nr:response regulator [Oscillatoriaceae cyanobacterium M33_DOE_052]
MGSVGSVVSNLPPSPPTPPHLPPPPTPPRPPVSPSAPELVEGPSLWLVLARDVAEQQQLATELAAKNADLVRLNRLKDEFLACISHELKTPLTSVLGLSSLLKDQSVGKLNDRQARYAELIHRSGRHLMAVVNDILDLTRIETGQMELIAEPVKIDEVCYRAFEQATGREHLSSSAAPPGTDDGRHWHLEIDPGLETIVADELRLRQMLSHLLSNALKFTPKGRDIGLKVNRWESWIAFTVWDNGLGIPAEKQHLIFQKFQQLENPLIRQFEGTGLGLVLTQGIARAHGGDVTFISKEDHGSEFTILLPPCPPSATTAGVPVVRDKQLVLLVEAVPRFVESVTGMLSALGLRTCIARAGTDALEKARRLQPGAVLIDPLLPLLSGWDALTLIKSDPQTRHIPAVMMGTLADKKQALERYADGFLLLPVQEEALRDELTRLHCLHVNRESIPPTKLTVLRLIPTENPSPNPLLADNMTSDHGDSLRLLEAYDLDQAELLARIWQPNAILLDGISLMSEDVNGFLQDLSEYPSLGSVPVVTLDRQTTEAANKISGLNVFPCLLPLAADGANRSPSSQLIDVIKLAAGMHEKPTILVVDLSRLPEFSPPETGDRGEGGEPQRLFGHREIGREPTGLSVAFNPGSRIHRSSEVEAWSPNPYPNPQGNQNDGAWLPALIQYLQTAGFKGTIASSWSEVWQQLHHQGVDLLVLYWRHGLKPSPSLLEALRDLGQVHSLPPVFVLRSRGERLFSPTTPVEKKSVLPLSGGVAIDEKGSFDLPEIESPLENGMEDLDNGNIGADFHSVVRSIATKILPSSLSMSQLLHEIILSLQG